MKPAPKVLLFTLEFPPQLGGVASYYGAVSKFWPEPDKLVVLNNNSGLLISAWLPAAKWLPAAIRLFLSVKRHHIGHILVGQILPLGTAAWLVTRLTKTPYSVFLHGMDFAYAWKAGRKRFLARLILKRADKLICASSYTAAYVKKCLGGERPIVVVNPGVSKIAAAVDPGLAAGLREKYGLSRAFVIFSLGRLVRRKGFDKVISAWPMITASLQNARYVIAGTGPDEKYLRDLARALPDGPRRKITFLGAVSEAEKQAWFSLAHLFIMPSRRLEDGGGADFEGFGIVYLEAATYGVPSVAGKSGGTADAVIDGQTGLLVTPDDLSAIIRAVVGLGSDPDRLRRLGENARRRVLEEFDWPGRIKNIHELVKP